MRWLHVALFTLAILVAGREDVIAQAPSRSADRSRPTDRERTVDGGADSQPAPQASTDQNDQAPRPSTEAPARPESAGSRTTRRRRQPAADHGQTLVQTAVAEEAGGPLAEDAPDQKHTEQTLSDELPTREKVDSPELPVRAPRRSRARAGQTELAANETSEQQPAATNEDWRKQFELQQQKIDILEKMVKLTADQVKKQGPSLEELQAQMAEMESRSKLAADRDQQLADGLDNLNDHLDAAWRYGPKLPSQLKEWFLPGGTNESPLSIYGSIVQNFSQVNGQPGQFDAGTISPYFLLQLNNRFLLESVVDLGADGSVGISQIQMDWIVSDATTIVVGRYLTPIGFFNERLNHEWINKLPDTALMFNQVSPLLSTNGVQVRGSQYILGSPVKLEYSLYGGNSASLGTTPDSPPNQQIVDLMAITGAAGSFNAIGGRLGLWIPELGLNFGMSGYSQGAYAFGATDRFQLYGFDASFHKGNWDARFEFAQNFQQATSYIGNDIRRTGLYTQLAYRDYKNVNPILASIELIGRFSLARFSGIDTSQIDLTQYAPTTAPVDRNQYDLGINYYLYPSMFIKFAYEWNPALGDVALNDNTFMSQFVWAF